MSTNLPNGYTELEYIESTGTQYINTGINSDQSIQILMTAKFSEIPTYNSWIFGGRNANQYNTIGLFYFATSGPFLASDYNLPSYRATISGITVTDWMYINNNANVCTINEKSVTHPNSSFQSNFPICIFANNTGGSISGFSKLYCSTAKIFKNSILVRNFVPSKNSSGEIGLFDLVSETFFGNSGSGTFVAGPEVISVPDAPGDVSQQAAVALTWGAVNCQGYRVYKNGAAIATTTEPNYVDYNISDGETIEYSVTAYNGAYESDAVSESVTVKFGYTILIPAIKNAFFQ